MKLVVDTNIVFSAILNSSKGVGKLLLTSEKYFDLYTCAFLRAELHHNHAKLKKLSKLSDRELDEVIDSILENITILHEDIIPIHYRQKAYNLLADIDEYDSPFLALALYLDCRLWTGDKTMVKGLLKKKCYTPILTPDLITMMQ